MISDKILYDKQIELDVKQMFQLKLSEKMFLITLYTCLETTLQVSEIVDKIFCWVLFFAFFILLDFWRGEASTAIRFFGHPLRSLLIVSFFDFTNYARKSMTAFWFCYVLYIAPSPERTRI